VAEELKRELGVDAQLIPGDRGEFTVWVDQQRVASKHHDGEFPTGEEAVAAVRGAMPQRK
jgi:predicted Rdx family selenoprotein